MKHLATEHNHKVVDCPGCVALMARLNTPEKVLLERLTLAEKVCAEAQKYVDGGPCALGTAMSAWRAKAGK